MKVLVFLAEGFEEVEALTVVDYLRRTEIEVDTVSITEDKSVKGAHDIIVMADKVLSDIDHPQVYDGVVIPGGIPGATNLRDNKDVIDIVRQLDEKKKLVAAICAGPIVLQQAGIIEGKDITSYPGFEDQLEGCVYCEDRVVRDGHIITSRGPSIAADFVMEIIDYLQGQGKINQLKESILYELE